MLNLLAKNIASNSNLIAEGGGSASVVELIWAHADDLASVGGANTGEDWDLIIGSDLLYITAAHGQLLETVSTLAGENTTVLMGFAARRDSHESSFTERAEKDFGFECKAVHSTAHKGEEVKILSLTKIK